MVQCRARCLPGDVGRVAGRALCAFDRLLHRGQSLHHGAVSRVALQKCAHAGQVGGCVGQPVQGAAPEVLQLLGIGIGLLCQGLDLLHHGRWVATLVHAQLQLCQPVAGLPGLLVQPGQLALGFGALLGGGAHDLVVLQRQSSERGRALREQLARQVGGLGLAACACHQAHLGEFFAVGAIHAHQSFEFLGQHMAGVAGTQGGQSALGLIGFLFAQSQVAQRCQPLRRVRVHGQQFVHQLAGHVRPVLAGPQAGAAEQLRFDSVWGAGMYAVLPGQASGGKQGQ